MNPDLVNQAATNVAIGFVLALVLPALAAAAAYWWSRRD